MPKVGEPFNTRGLMKGLFIPEGIMTDTDLSPSDRFVWANLAYRKGEKATAWPSAKRIASDVNISEKQARTSLKRLEELRYINRMKPEGVDRLTHRNTRYELLWHQSLENSLLDTPERNSVPVRKGTDCRPTVKDSGVKVPSSSSDTIVSSEEPAVPEKPTRAKKPGKPNPHYDAFAAAYEQKHGEPYISTKADFIQLNNLLKVYTDSGRKPPPPEQFADLAKWAWNEQDKFTSSVSLTVKGLCSQYSKLSATRKGGKGRDAWNVPAPPGKYAAIDKAMKDKWEEGQRKAGKL